MFYVYAACKMGYIIHSRRQKNTPEDKPKEDGYSPIFPFPPSTPNTYIHKEVLPPPSADSNVSKPALNWQLVPSACRARIHWCTNMVTEVRKKYTTLVKSSCLQRMHIDLLTANTILTMKKILFCLLTFPNHHGISYSHCHGFYTELRANSNLAWDK